VVVTRRPGKLFLFFLILIAAAALMLPTVALAGWTWDGADGWTWDGNSVVPADTTPLPDSTG
jgi:hypothetical protein